MNLVVSRAVAEIFGDSELRELVAIRGGTVLNKFYFGGGSRYSEDIDLVRIRGETAGPLFDLIRKGLDPWLGKPKREIGPGGIKLIYRFQSEAVPPLPMRLKVEINTTECFSVLGYEEKAFGVESPWFAGRGIVTTLHCLSCSAPK